MDNVRNTRLRLCSLSVFRGILGGKIPSAFLRLLGALDSAPDEFLSAYGELFALLCEEGRSDNLALALTEAALYDDNCFTRAAAGGRINELPSATLRAVEADCRAILDAASLTAEDILNACVKAREIKPLGLPLWETGDPAPGFAAFDGSAESAAEFYRKNGCGIFAKQSAFLWRDGDMRPVLSADTIDLSKFTGYERQRQRVIANTEAFLDGKPCNNCLLFGDMGTGKSSTVKAVANAYRDRGLRIVEIPKEQLTEFPLLADKISGSPMKFIIFIDDLSFQYHDNTYTALKAVLEGGLAKRPENALIYATSNRRHLVKERLSDRSVEVDDIHTRDNMQETLSLSDRFGLTVCFTVPGKRDYLDIVRALAEEKGLNIPEQELEAGAERFALARGGRSPRCAKQYVESLFS